MKGGLLLDVVVSKGAAILQLLSGKDQSLLVWWDPLLILDLRLHVVDGIRTLHLQSDGLSGEGLNEDLHTTTETEDKVKCRLLLDVIVGEGAPVLELLTGEDQPLLVRWDALEGGLLLDVVVDEGAAVLELLSGEDEPLLVRWDAFLVLDLGLDVVDGVGALDLDGDGDGE